MKKDNYDPIDDLKYLSTSAAAIAMVLGFSEKEIKNCSIDDIINRTRQIFAYKHMPAGPCSEAVKKHHIYITRAARRYWNSIQVARHASKYE